jgi:FxLD family lantipeptide
MTISNVASEALAADEWAEDDPFDLDIRFVEQADIALLINLTDDGCTSTCPKACATNMG